MVLKIQGLDTAKIEKILKHLKKRKRKGITGLEARDLYGSYRLADAIFKLKKR